MGASLGIQFVLSVLNMFPNSNTQLGALVNIIADFYSIFHLAIVEIRRIFIAALE